MCVEEWLRFTAPLLHTFNSSRRNKVDTRRMANAHQNDSLVRKLLFFSSGANATRPVTFVTSKITVGK